MRLLRLDAEMADAAMAALQDGCDLGDGPAFQPEVVVLCGVTPETEPAIAGLLRQGVVVLALTDVDQLSLRARLARPGEIDCMVAPFAPEELIARVSGHAQALRAQAEARRQLQEARAEHQRLTAVLSAVPVGVVITDTAGRILQASSEARRIWRKPIEATSLADYQQFVAWWPDGQPLAGEEWAVSRALRYGEVSVGEVIDIERGDGTRGTILNSAGPVTSSDGTLIGAVAVFADVTRERQVEAELRDSEARYRFLAESLPFIVWTMSPDGQATYVNQRLSDYTGSPVAPNETNWAQWVHPDDVDRVRQAIGSIVEGRELTFESRVLRADGEYRWFLNKLVPMHDDQGHVVHWLGTAMDLEETKAAEASQRQAQKMDAVARLAGGVAHEVNNMMAAVMGFAELLLQGLDPQDPRRVDVHAIADAAGRAAAITRQLLAFSGRQMVQPKSLDVAALVREMLPLLWRAVPPGVTIDLRTGPQPAWVRLDRGQFEEVILALAVNAGEAMPDGGRLTIEVSCLLPGDDDLPPPTERTEEPAAHVLLTFRDTGPGMDAQTLGQIFEPFFTTKAHGAGRGLGLSTVYGIVKHAGGHVRVDSQPGQGATFLLYLPRIEPAVEAPARDEAVLRTGTVLVVDDEPLVRRLAARVLAGAGYAVLEASSAAEALALLEGHTGALDLVLTDVVMPGMSGRELGERLARDRPDLPVLYMSGFTDDEIVRRALLPRGAALLEKPFSAQALLQRVQAVLRPGARL